MPVGRVFSHAHAISSARVFLQCMPTRRGEFLLGLPVVAKYRSRWLSCIFILVDKLQLLHHPDVLHSAPLRIL